MKKDLKELQVSRDHLSQGEERVAVLTRDVQGAHVRIVGFPEGGLGVGKALLLTLDSGALALALPQPRLGLA